MIPLYSIRKSKDNLKNTLSQINDTISQKTQAVKSKITETTQSIKNKKDNVWNDLVQKYHQTPISKLRNQRPDVTLLLEVTVVVILLVLLYLIWPYLSASKSHIFSKEQYLKAAQLPESQFTVDEMSKYV